MIPTTENYLTVNLILREFTLVRGELDSIEELAHLGDVPISEIDTPILKLDLLLFLGPQGFAIFALLSFFRGAAKYLMNLAKKFQRLPRTFARQSLPSRMRPFSWGLWG